MKTIRTNCFETNSSSTHSITIESKSRYLKEDKTLLEDGVLIPENLRYTSAFRESSGDGHTLHATTRDQKAALLICHISSLDGAGRCDKKVAKQVLVIAKELLIELCGYEDVSVENLGYTLFSCYDEQNSTYLDVILGEADYSKTIDTDDVRKGIRKHILSVVLNDDAIIIDSEDSY